MARSTKETRSIVKFQSTQSPHCYFSEKNRRNTTEKITIKKYDPIVRKHVEYREVKV